MSRFWYIFQANGKEVYRTTAETLTEAKQAMRAALTSRGWNKIAIRNVKLSTNN